LFPAAVLDACCSAAAAVPVRWSSGWRRAPGVGRCSGRRLLPEVSCRGAVWALGSLKVALWSVQGRVLPARAGPAGSA
jgi:hypothetical protein